MEGEDNDPDPPTGTRDIYESRPVNGGRKIVRTNTVSSGSNQNDAFVNVLDKDGNSLRAYSGSNAVAEYTRDYGLYKEFESIASDGKGNLERAFWSTKEVIKIAATDPETQPILLMPVGALADILMAGSVTAGYTISTGSNILKPLGLGSTGRAVAANLNEQLAMKEIMSNPNMGKVVMKGMKDARWAGWDKMQYTHTALDGSKTTIHYVGKFEKGVLRAVDDFKFK